MDAFSKAADGRATKIIVPSELQGLVGLTAGVLESVAGARASSAQQDSTVKQTARPAVPVQIHETVESQGTGEEKK